MDEEIGSGNTEIKMESAKAAAIAAVVRALANRATEVAVLGFSGECHNPVSEHLDFTTDVHRLTRFINGLQPGGGTPMAEAVLVANRFMQSNRSPGASSQMIVLLADGDNDCGDVAQAMAELQDAGIVFRHETVGFGIEPTSDAARDLRHLATTSGGQYHHAASATQLADVFMEFADTFTVIDMLGMFGSDAPASAPGGQTAPADGAAAVLSTQPDAGTAGSDGGSGGVTDMIGMFTIEPQAEDEPQADADEQAEVVRLAAAEQEAQICLASCENAWRGRSALQEGEAQCKAACAYQCAGNAEAVRVTCELARAVVDRLYTGSDKSSVCPVCGSLGPDSPPMTAGALAADDRGLATRLGWAAGHASVGEAEREALDQCGSSSCRVIMSFEEGCAAYATGQTQDELVVGMASGHDSESQATQAALDGCKEGGAADCVVREWTCGG